MGFLIIPTIDTRFILHSHGAHYCYEVHPETVGQYTGLKDRNGVKIFEGDVIEDSYGNIGVIDYSCHFVQWRIIFRKGREDLIDKYGVGCSIFDWIYPRITLRVIGNIHDNPELLPEAGEQ